MSRNQIIKACQIAGHVLLNILSLSMLIPFGMNLHEFDQHCLLFTTGEWREEDGKWDPRWASLGFCEIPLVSGVIVFIVSIVQTYRYVRMKEEASFLSLFCDAVLSIWMCAMSIISAFDITMGFIVWCDGMTERFPSCKTAAGQRIIHGPDSDKIDTTNFYFDMGTAQFGAWGCFAITVGVCVISILKLVNNHQLRNIKVSMYLERQRLVNQPPMDGRSTPPLEAIGAVQGASTSSDAEGAIVVQSSELRSDSERK